VKSPCFPEEFYEYYQKNMLPGVVVHPVIPALGKLRQEDCEFLVSLGYTVRPVSKEPSQSKPNQTKTKKPSMLYPGKFPTNN
jgi:hypothetical protein